MIIDLIVALANDNSKLLDPAKSKELLQYFLSEKGLKAGHLHKNIKDGILSMFSALSDSKRTFFTKNKDLTENLMHQMVGFMLAAKNLGKFDDNEVCLGFSSIRLFEILSENLPKKTIKPILGRIQEELFKSKDPKQLVAMYLIYSAIASGMQDILKTELPNLMKEQIAFGLNHENVQVKNAAIKAISYFSEFLLPNILEYTNVVIPSLVKAMDSSDIDLVEHSVFVLDVFTEYLEENQVKDYLPVLVPKIVVMVTHPKATYRVRRFSIDALCSLMNAGKGVFGPYLEQSYLVLREILNSTTEEVKLAHGTALQCMGKLLSIVCEKDKSQFSSKFIDIHQKVINYIKTEPNNFDLMEGCYTFLYLAVEVLGEEYGKEVIPQIADHAKATVEKESVVRGGDEEDDDDEEGEGNEFVLVNLDEAKSAILHLFGELGNHSPFSFAQIEAGVLVLLEGCLTFNDKESPQLRMQTLVALKGILIGKIKRANNGLLPPFRKGWDTPAMSDEIMNFFQNEYFMKVEFYICNEKSKDDVCLAIEAFKDALKETGPAVLRNTQEHLVKLVQAITSFDLSCFDKGDDDEEDQESDGKIFMALMDLLVVVSDNLKGDAFSILKEVLPGVVELVHKGEVFELDEFLGGYCDIVENCPALIAHNTDIITDMIYESPALEDPLPVRNGCFLLGVMHEANPEAMEPYVQKSLNFYMQCHSSFKEPEVKDNVVAGIVRIYNVDKKGLVPQGKLIETVLQSYPFTGDKSENPTLVSFAQTLLNKGTLLLNSRPCNFRCQHPAYMQDPS